ncbi:MAG: hypothetical protein KGO01_09950, partial [Burkholderiales bacterium]|nr:hypothetical protein [Burkholderiales bacterium]
MQTLPPTPDAPAPPQREPGADAVAEPRFPLDGPFDHPRAAAGPAPSADSALRLAEATIARGDMATALELAGAAVQSCARSAPGSAEHVRARAVLAQAFALAGAVPQSLAEYTAALGDARRLGSALWLCKLHSGVASVLEDGPGLYRDALRHACTAYRAAEAAQLVQEAHLALARMLLALARIGAPEQAERLGLAALARSREDYNNFDIHRVLHNLAVVCTCGGDQAAAAPAQAAGFHERSLDYARRACRIAAVEPSLYARLATMQTLGTSCLRLQRYEEADGLLDRCIAETRRRGLSRIEVPALRDRAWGLIGRQRHADALRFLDLALKIAAPVGNRRNRRPLRAMRAACLAALGRGGEADPDPGAWRERQRAEQALCR